PDAIHYIIIAALSVCNVHGTPAVPSISEASMGNTTALIGQDVHFKCSVENMADKNTIIFLRPGPPQKMISYEGQIFSPLKRKYELTTRGGPFGNQWTLTIKNAQPSDRGLYACQLNGKTISTKIGFLDLKIPPSIAQSTPSAVEVREGQNVTLACKADGEPTPTISWRRQDRQIIRVDGQEGFGASVFHGPEMNLTRVSRRHMSEYVCVASNGIGPDESWAIKLLVTFTPHVLAKKRLLAVRRGQVARLVCDVEAWPRPEVVWQHDGQYVHEGHQYTQNYSVTGQLTTAHVLEIRAISPKNYGLYRCTARNDNGLHHADIELVESEDDARFANRVRPEGSGDTPPSSSSLSSVDDEDSDDNTADFYQYTTESWWQTSTLKAHPVHHRHRHHEPATVMGRPVDPHGGTTVPSVMSQTGGRLWNNGITHPSIDILTVFSVIFLSVLF
ncbi:hypothetical protein PMAYCL1PPCAC_25369, partial [Pristionchus mayeri]